jgi:hypothetical protein
MKDDRHKDAIPETVLTQVYSQIEAVKTALAPYTLALTPQERRACSRWAIKTDAKAASPKADTSVLERRVDNLVYRLYDLSWEEVKVIEPEFPLSKAECD